MSASNGAGFCYAAASCSYEMVGQYELDTGGEPTPALDRAAELRAADADRTLEPLQSAANVALLRLATARRDGRDLGPLRAALALRCLLLPVA